MEVVDETGDAKAHKQAVGQGEGIDSIGELLDLAVAWPGGLGGELIPEGDWTGSHGHCLPHHSPLHNSLVLGPAPSPSVRPPLLGNHKRHQATSPQQRGTRNTSISWGLSQTHRPDPHLQNVRAEPGKLLFHK